MDEKGVSAAARFTLSPFGIDELLELCMGNVATAAVALNEFEKEALSDLGRIQASLAENDPSGIATAAHALKGAAGMLRADELRRIAADLERIGRSHDLSQARQSVDALREEIRRCLDYLPEVRMLVAERARSRTGGAP